MLGKVIVTARAFSISPEPMKYLVESNCDVELKPTAAGVSEDWLVEQCSEADALIAGMEVITARVIDSAPRLRVIARTGVGYDTVDVDAATRRGVAVCNTRGANDQAVADFTMGLVLMAARRVLDGVDSCRRGGWDRVVGVEVWGKTLSIVGLGRIGKAVAQRARGFEMRVLAVDVVRDEEFASRYGIEYVSLEQALREGDFISLNAPHTPETEGIINERTIALMKPTAFLVNTARGGLVDEEALAAAVRTNRIAGAAVDVLREEGANSSSPLLRVPGIIVTPHMAAYSYEAMERMALVAAQNVVAVLKGGRAPNAVNLAIYEVGRT